MRVTAFVCDKCGALLTDAKEDRDTGKHYCWGCYEKEKVKDKDLRVWSVDSEHED